MAYLSLFIVRCAAHKNFVWKLSRRIDVISMSKTKVRND